MIDRLIDRIEALNNPTVVGLDPAPEMMPDGLRREMYERFGKTPKAVAEMFLRFNRAIIDSIADIVPAVKPQIAMYERYGLDGVTTYLQTTEYAASKGLLVIGDIKRGDIASTAEAYAAHLAGVEVEGARFDLWKEDAVTVNPYLGGDSIAPFLQACKDFDKGVFVLVKTSNAGSGDIQDLQIGTTGGADRGETVCMRVARLVEQWGRDSVGARGYSRVGAVVGATQGKTGEHLRSLLPHTFLLAPGYGAQGARAEDIRGFFDARGGGAIVNSSRGVIAAWRKEQASSRAEAGPGSGEAVTLDDVGSAARRAAVEMRTRLREITG
ncbi:MAG: orotidine-5'-phosphate decarboxylase [Clostridiales Family XIII bacterium]|jgi:orotidine-5'-phosphate decarboxylase|nr:orotidine-5'-phosphate decarboxylase [Clostridiales Family XIII bacterium]